MSMKSELLFDLIESEADVNVFLHREGFTAEKAGIIITSSSIGHFPKMPGDKYTVWFGRGIKRFTFKKFNDACDKVLEILDTANQKIDPTITGRQSQKFKKKYESHKQTSGDSTQ